MQARQVQTEAPDNRHVLRTVPLADATVILGHRAHPCARHHRLRHLAPGIVGVGHRRAGVAPGLYHLVQGVAGLGLRLSLGVGGGRGQPGIGHRDLAVDRGRVVRQHGLHHPAQGVVLGVGVNPDKESGDSTCRSLALRHRPQGHT